MLFVYVAHLSYDGPVAIGNEFHGQFLRQGVLAICHSLCQLFFHPVVVVLHNHQLVAPAKHVVAVEHLITDALIVDVCTFV